MNKVIKVSVVIPTYNRLNTGLKKCIKSVLLQTYQPHEIIIIDDGSTDKTESYIKSLNIKKLKYIKLKHTGSPAIARNIGIKNSNGNYIAFIDSDDQWLKNKLSAQIDIIKKYKKNAICSNAYINSLDRYYFQSSSLCINKNLLISTNKIINSSVLINKSILLKAELYPESSLYKFEDYLLWYKISFISDFYYINEPLLIYSENNTDRLSIDTKKHIFYNTFITECFFINYALKKFDFVSIKKIIVKNFFKVLDFSKSYIGINNNLTKNKNQNFKKKISIIMPSYNNENYIDQAIESILGQDYPNFEFLIMNDGSTDRTEEIIRFYLGLNSKIKIFNNKKRKGISYCLNKLIQNANGDFIARMDADDISSKDRLSKQIAKFARGNIDILSSGVRYFGNKNTLIKYNNPCLNNSQIQSRLLFYNPINHPTIFFKSSLKNLFKYKTINDGFEDWALWIELINQNIKFYCSDELVLVYRLHAKNSGNIPNLKLEEKINKIISKFYQIKNFKFKSFNEINLIHLKIMINILLNNKNINFNINELKKIEYYKIIIEKKFRSLLIGPKSIYFYIFFIKVLYQRFILRRVNF